MIETFDGQQNLDIQPVLDAGQRRALEYALPRKYKKNLPQLVDILERCIGRELSYTRHVVKPRQTMLDQQLEVLRSGLAQAKKALDEMSVNDKRRIDAVYEELTGSEFLFQRHLQRVEYSGVDVCVDQLLDTVAHCVASADGRSNRNERRNHLSTIRLLADLVDEANIMPIGCGQRSPFVKLTDFLLNTVFGYGVDARHHVKELINTHN